MSCISKFEAVDQIFKDFDIFQTKSIFEIISREEIEENISKDFDINFAYARFGSKMLDYQRLLDIVDSIRRYSIPKKYINLVKKELSNKKDFRITLEKDIKFFEYITKSFLAVQLGYGECNEFNGYFLANYFNNYLEIFKGAILEIAYFNSRNLNENHVFSILIHDYESISLISESLKEKKGLVSFEDLLLSFSENDILVDAFHKERCYLKDVKKEAIKTLKYIETHGLDSCYYFSIKSEKDLENRDILKIGFDFSVKIIKDKNSDESNHFTDHVFRTKSDEFLELERNYNIEVGIYKEIIKKSFPEVIFRNTGQLLITDVTKEIAVSISDFLHLYKLEFYQQEKTDDIISLLINCYRSF